MLEAKNAPAAAIETLGDIARLLEPGRKDIAEGTPVRGFSVDSRTLNPGDLFVAIAGNRVDGHQFVPEVFQKGAAGCLVSAIDRDWPAEKCIRADDPVRALGFIAAAHRRAMPAKVIALTGSAGKTTTKDLLHGILETAYQARKSEGNFNSTIGLPMQLLKLTAKDEWFVAEMGMSTPGEIHKLVDIAKPDIGLWLNVSEAHLANFGSIHDIAKAKAELVEHLAPDRTMVYNLDDPLVRDHCEDYQGQHFTFGFVHPEANLRGRIEPFSDWHGTHFQITLNDDRAYPQYLPIPGRYNVQNAMAACAAAIAAGFPVADLVNGLRSTSLGPHRSHLLEFDGDIMLVDDTYNSNPRALEKVLRCFASLAPHYYRWIVLGDMLELGPGEKEIHRDLGHRLARLGFDRITLTGSLTRYTAEALRESHGGDYRVEYFPNLSEALNDMDLRIPQRSRIWCKASRGIQLESVVEVLKTHFAAGITQ